MNITYDFENDSFILCQFIESLGNLPYRSSYVHCRISRSVHPSSTATGRLCLQNLFSSRVIPSSVYGHFIRENPATSFIGNIKIRLIAKSDAEYSFLHSFYGAFEHD